jgi:hypothetical protein
MAYERNEHQKKLRENFCILLLTDVFNEFDFYKESTESYRDSYLART